MTLGKNPSILSERLKVTNSNVTAYNIALVHKYIVKLRALHKTESTLSESPLFYRQLTPFPSSDGI